MDKPSRIFLAHATEDKNMVRKIYTKLKSEGFTPWLDEEDLLPGQIWQEEIPKAIQHCKIFIAFLSTQSINKQGYIQKEFRLALNTYAEKPPNSIFFIPLKLDDCEVPDLQIPQLSIKLRDIQWLDYWKPHGFAQLLRVIKTQIPETTDNHQPSQHHQVKLESIKPDDEHGTVISLADIKSLQQSIDQLLRLVETQTPNQTGNEQSKPLIIPPVTQAHKTDQTEQQQSPPSHIAQALEAQVPDQPDNRQNQPRQKKIAQDKKKSFKIGPYIINEAILNSLIIDYSRITQLFRDHFFSEIRYQLISNPNDLSKSDHIKSFFNRVCHSTLNSTRTQFQDYFKATGIKIEEDLSLTIHLLISHDEAQTVMNSIEGDKGEILSPKNKHMVTAYRDSYTWERNLERREIKQVIYKVEENIMFDEIINKGNSKFSCNNLRGLQLNKQYFKNSQFNNSLLVVPIRSHTGQQNEVLYYGTLTIDSLNPKGLDLFSGETTFHLLNNAANILALTLGIIDILFVFDQK